MANRTHVCKYCKKRSEEAKKFGLSYFCDSDCAMKYSIEKSRKDKVKQDRKEFNERKKAFNLSDTRHQHKLTQKAFNKMRVLEELFWFKEKGIEPYCISCGKTNMDWCCGHFKTVGSSGALRYDGNNTFLQCNKYCNMSKSGNIEGCKNTYGYKKGLSIRFGEEEAKRIIYYCEQHQGDVKKWTGKELEEIRKEFNSYIRELEKLLN